MYSILNNTLSNKRIPLHPFKNYSPKVDVTYLKNSYIAVAIKCNMHSPIPISYGA
jgi:hypothetical protein